MPDGSMYITEEDDQAPVHHKNVLDVQSQGEPPMKQYLDRTATKGQGGDTTLAHVNPWEAMLLKKLGGVGTTNPNTGLRQFYIDPVTGLENGLPDPNAATATSPTFNFPMDIMPTSTSASSSYSGLPASYQESLLSSLMPQLQSSITNMPGNIDQYTNEALGSYNQIMNNAIKTNIPKALAGLSNRGILNSTEGQGVLSNVYSQAAMDASNKGYTTAMQAALLKANMPSILAQIADLGKSTGTSSIGYAADPTVMYRTMADLIKSMM